MRSAFCTAMISCAQTPASALRSAPDIARAISRLALQRGGPRDLGAVRDGLTIAGTCARLLREGGGGIGLPSALADIADRLEGCGSTLADLLARALIDELPHQRRDGNFVRAGFLVDLDEARALRDDSRKVMAALEAKYVEETGYSRRSRSDTTISWASTSRCRPRRPSLCSAIHWPQSFRHRQTMAGAVRFTTSELIETESRIVCLRRSRARDEQERLRRPGCRHCVA